MKWRRSEEKHMSSLGSSVVRAGPGLEDGRAGGMSLRDQTYLMGILKCFP